MLTTLSKKQEEQLPVYRDKWIAIGRSTAPLNKEKAAAAMRQVYLDGKLLPPSEILFMPSPMAACRFLQENYEFESEGDIINAIIYGQTDANWLGFYEYFKEVCGVKEAAGCKGLTELAKQAGWCFVFEELAVICERPVALHFNEQNQLHCTNGPAIKYSNGDSLYRLNGVEMPEWLFTTPKDQLDPKEIIGIKNVEQRAEAIKWYGMDRLLGLLKSKVIEKGTEFGYELLEVDVGTGRKERYLKMNNPSTPEVHVEGVPRETASIRKADEFRQGRKLVEKYGYSKPKARA